jgi:Uncharacterised nucleotidyltransferase
MDESLNLLAKAALAPLDVAIAAWQRWRATYNIDTTPWNEVRMLGAVASRIDELEPNSPIRPRVFGIRKFLWVQSQICLKNCESGLAALEQSRVPMMLMKGAARTARDPLSVQERLIRDVDVLVPLALQTQAFAALQKAEWSIAHTPWQIQMHELGPISSHHAWSFSKGQSEIDLHHVSNHLNRLRGDDDGFWARALPTVWQGKHVFIPSSADALLIALIHGVRWSQDRSADWTVDACALLDEGPLDWGVFMQEARGRQIQAHVHSGLAYLRDALQKSIPDDVMASLLTEATSEQCRELAFYSSEDSAKTLEQIQIAMQMALSRAAARRGELASPMHPTAARPSQGSGTAPCRKWVRFPLYDLSEHDRFVLVTLTIHRKHCSHSEHMQLDLMWPGLQSIILQLEVPPRNSPVVMLGMPHALLDLRSIELLALRIVTDGPMHNFNVDFSMTSHDNLPASLMLGSVVVKLAVAKN